MKVSTERYQFGGWTDPRAVYAPEKWVRKRPYGAEFDERGLPLMKRKVDAHEYTTEAKDLPIEACVNMWIIKYGDGAVPAVETREQDVLMWEIGNRLWWANRMKYDKANDTYEIID